MWIPLVKYKRNCTKIHYSLRYERNFETSSTHISQDCYEWLLMNKLIIQYVYKRMLENSYKNNS